MASGSKKQPCNDHLKAKWSSRCRQIIKVQKEVRGIKRDVDVEEIHLDDRQLEGICDFIDFPNLNILWLSKNRLRRLDCFKHNFRITELHLQYNLLKDISGALCHLTQLAVLMLQGNQLSNLEQVVKQFRKMQNLQILNMFDNPLAQEREYRLYTVYHVPSVKILDRRAVEYQETCVARSTYDQKNEQVRNTIAFLRRSEGPPDLYYPSNPPVYSHLNPSPPPNQGARPSTAEVEQEFEARVNTKALWTYNYFDWSKITPPSTKRIEKTDVDEPEIISVRFK